MNAVICCIAKCENPYIDEWVQYHLALGFDHIYIYDNNDLNGEIFPSNIAENSKVTIINCRGKLSYQEIAYTLFYKEYSLNFDWVAYIDVDEFITFSKESSIANVHDFLSRFSTDVDIIHLNWMCYGDSDTTDISTWKVIDRFVTPLEYDKKVQYNFPENNHVKPIIRGGMEIGDRMINVHTPREGEYKVADANGCTIENSCFKPYDFSVAYIRHYVTKTIYEWLAKISRGLATVCNSDDLYTIDRFFLYNKPSKEKQDIVDLYLFFKKNIDMLYSMKIVLLTKELDYANTQLNKVSNDYSKVLSSKAYRYGRILLRPLKEIKSIFSNFRKSR